MIYSWSITLRQLPVGTYASDVHVARDFVHFYSQGVATREHDAHALYDLDALAAVVDRVVPDKVDAKFPPVYGPQVGLFFAPLARLAYVPALLTWLAVSLTGYALLVSLVWRTCPTLRRERWTTALLAVGAPGLYFTMSFGQASLIGLACTTALWLALRRERMFLAGLAIGALAYKPQFGLVAAFVFVLAGEWRVVAGAVVAIAAQGALSLAWWDASIFQAYAGVLATLPSVVDAMEPHKELMHSLRSFFLHLGVPQGVSLVVSAVASLAAAVAALACWRARGDMGLRYVVLLIATLLVNPHLFVYDLLLLSPALLVVWDWANRQGGQAVAGLVPAWVPARVRLLPLQQAVVALAYFCYAAPLLSIALSRVPVQWSVPGLLVLGAALVRVQLVPGRAPARQP
ncbi:MAG: glycosyltransferase family 87 protein [Vicinamibacterales bacterium]